MNTLDELLSRLRTVNSSVERNALAMEATETGDPKVPTVLIELIDRPELANERGTLVNCLGHFDCSNNFLWLLKLVCHGNWEVAHEAMGILKKIDHVAGRDVKQGYDFLQMTIDARTNDEWRASWIADLLSMFD